MEIWDWSFRFRVEDGGAGWLLPVAEGVAEMIPEISSVLERGLVVWAAIDVNSDGGELRGCGGGSMSPEGFSNSSRTVDGEVSVGRVALVTT